MGDHRSPGDKFPPNAREYRNKFPEFSPDPGPTIDDKIQVAERERPGSTMGATFHRTGNQDQHRAQNQPSVDDLTRGIGKATKP